jgi:hypothetical protein
MSSPSPSFPLSPLSSLRPCVSSTALYTPSALPTTLCTLYSPLSSLRPSVSSTVYCLLYHSLSPLQLLSSLRPSALSTALCSSTAICLPVSPLRPSANSTAFCALYRPLLSLWNSAPLTALCPLYGSMSSLLCPLFVSPLLSHCFSFPLSTPLVSLSLSPSPCLSD